MNDDLTQTNKGKAIQPGVLFKPGSWFAKIDFINHLILFNNVVITILAEKEGGKTSFCTLLQNNMDQQIKSFTITSTPSCTKKSILEEISRHFSLDYDDNTEMESIVVRVNELNAHKLIIIDDAHNLPEEFIRDAMQAIKNQGDFGFFHLCLISDHTLTATLNALAVKPLNDLIHTIDLSSLNENETRTYVLQRAIAAHLITKPLTDQQFKQFYHLTKGNLAKINSKLEAFIFNCSNERKVKMNSILKGASMPLAAAIVLGAFYWQFSILKDTPAVLAPMVLPKIVEVIDKSKLYSAQFASQIPSWQEGATIQQLVNFVSHQDRIRDDFDAEKDTVAIVDKVIVIPKINAHTHLSAIPDVHEHIRPEIKLKAIETAKVTPFKPRKVKRAASQQYTIQLIASHNKKDIVHFMNNNKLLANSKMIHIKNADETWYILTMGDYKSRTEALLDVKKLPEYLTRFKPWIRPTSGSENIG